TRRFPSIYLPFRELESRKLCDSRTNKTSDGPEVKAVDTIIARTWKLVDRILASAKICPFSDTVPSIVDTRSNGYAPIVANKQSCLIGLVRWSGITLDSEACYVLRERELTVSGIVCRILKRICKTEFLTPGSSDIVRQKRMDPSGCTSTTEN
ncbi:hypothetical protein Tco_0632978, partial [Tanacetum coccineum]